ncbi:MAG TPA: patatin-like phospholipase family protein [Acidobacteriaceae bacterium]|nr:patatin-like phospholipase family protein [Acidobacteriaceae bacterium]
MGAPKYLAITISGAVSLGSYEAGAMFQVLDAIRQHNEHVQQTGAGDPIYVDVITGASAGGMTASILARKLLLDGPAFKGADSNPLYDTWVKRIDLSELIGTTEKPLNDVTDPARLSLLSSSLIATIAEETLQATVDGRVSDNGPHAVIDPSRGIRLGLALTNLTGINYGQTMADGSNFAYTDFSDQMLRNLTPQRDPGDRTWRDKHDLETWKELSGASVACGAFPGAFRAQDLERSYEDYQDDAPVGWSGGSKTFTYTDGGVLQNQPLGMAKNLVDDLDHHQNADRRFYLFVSPHPMDNRASSDLNADSSTILHILERLVSIYMGQAVFRDWVQADSVNHQIKLLDFRATQLTGQLTSATTVLDPAQLIVVAQQILTLLYVNDGGVASMAADSQRLTKQYAAEVELLGGAADPRAQAMLLTIQALEKGANLGQRDYMHIYGVVVDPKILAGAGIAAFVGFFSEAYRQHDYDCGRQKALELLAKINSAPAGQATLGPIHFEKPTDISIQSALNGLTLKNIQAAKVELFREGAIRRVNQILSEELGNPLERYPAQLGADLLLRAILGWEFSRDVQS